MSRSKRLIYRFFALLGIATVVAAITLLVPFLLTPSNEDFSEQVPLWFAPISHLIVFTVVIFCTPMTCLPVLGGIALLVIFKWTERHNKSHTERPKPQLAPDAKDALLTASSYLFTGSVAIIVIELSMSLIGASYHNEDFLGAVLALPTIAALFSTAISALGLAKYTAPQSTYRLPLAKSYYLGAIIICLLPVALVLAMFGNLASEHFNLMQPFVTLSTIVGATTFIVMAFIRYIYATFTRATTKQYTAATIYRLAQKASYGVIALVVGYLAVCGILFSNFSGFNWLQISSYLTAHDAIIGLPGLAIALINSLLAIGLIFLLRHRQSHADCTTTTSTPHNRLAGATNLLSLVFLLIPFMAPSAIAPILITRALNKAALKENPDDSIARAIHSLNKLYLLLYILELVITTVYFKFMLYSL